MKTRTSQRPSGSTPRIRIVLLFLLIAGRLPTAAQSLPAASTPPEKVILDTDIGDDVDDAFALALALSSNRLQILGVTTAWGDTALRARLVHRFLNQTGHPDIPVAAGPPTNTPGAPFTQKQYAEQSPASPNSPDAISFILRTIQQNPQQITLISLAPLTNIGALLQQDPATFRKLKRVVMMGGSIHQGYGDLGYLPNRGPSAEYNIKMDIPAAQALFASGVPIEMMPLDSTQLKLDEVRRSILFAQHTTVTKSLDELYGQWSAFPGNLTPTLYDAMPVAALLDPTLCPTTPLRIRVDDAGFTRTEPGPPNASVCLHSNADQFFHFYIPQILQNSDRR